MRRSVGEVESIQDVCGSLVELSRKREEEKIREQERKKESVKINKKIYKNSFNATYIQVTKTHSTFTHIN